jgi:hypothetical protein
MTSSSASISSNSSKSKIAIFYHVYQYGNWFDIFEEQSGLIKSSGLEDACSFIRVGINGDKAFAAPSYKFLFKYQKQPWLEETATLKLLYQFAQQNPDWKILYMHTKGVSQPMQSTQDWRKIMEYYCIEKWSDCIEKLDEHDAVGCLYMDYCYYGYFPHFSGNFWWANSDYIAKLDECFLNDGIRQNREFWIGTGNGSLYSFHTTGLNHYAHEYPRSLYVKS